jgi:hypothetical protein
VLSGLERADGVLGVQADGEDDVDAVDLGIVRDAVEVRVIVEPADPEARAEVLLLGRAAGDEGGHSRVPGIDEAGDRFADREVAEADDRPAQLLARPIGQQEIARERRAVRLLAGGTRRPERERRQRAGGEQPSARHIGHVGHGTPPLG